MFDPVTGFLLRQSRWRKRWEMHKVEFDGGLLNTFRISEWKLTLRDSVKASDILSVESILLVPCSVPVVPPGARADAPAGEATPAGLLVNIRGDHEILFCASNEDDRARWLEAFSPKDDPTDDAEKLYSTLRPLKEGEGRGAPLPEKGADEGVDAKGLGPPLSEKGADEGVDAKGLGPPISEKGANEGGDGNGYCGKGPGPPPPLKGKSYAGKGPGPPPPLKGKANGGKGTTAPGYGKKGGAPRRPKVHLVQGYTMSPDRAKDTAFDPESFSDRPTPNFPTLAGKPKPSRKPGTSKASAEAAETKVLEDRILMRMTITTQSVDLDALTAAAASMDANRGAFKDNLEGVDIFWNLLNELKGADPLGRLRAFALGGGRVEGLRVEERRLLKLSLVPRVLQRLQLLMMAATLQERASTVRTDLHRLLTAGRDIQASAHLRDVIHAMQEFMAWNDGTTSTSDGPRAFHIGQLLVSVKDIRIEGMARNRNLIHWIIETLQQWDRPIGADQLRSEVPSLTLAARTNPIHIDEELKAIAECGRLARDEFKKHSAEYITSLPLPSPQPEAQARNQSEGPEVPEVPQDAPRGQDASEAEVVAEAAAAPTTPREVPATMFFAMGAGVEGRSTMLPTDMPTDRLKKPVPRSAWDVSKLPRELHVPHLTRYKAGKFAHVVPRGGSMSSGGPPSQGLWREAHVWVLQPRVGRRPEWVRCWADIRAHHLILRHLDQSLAVRFESIISLPGAEITAFDFLTATPIGQWLAELKFHGFEIRPNHPHDVCPIFVHLGEEGPARHWFDELSEETALGGAGTLRRNAKKEVLWCTFDAEEKKLLCYASSVQFLLGTPPIYEHDIGVATVRSFSDPDASLSKVEQKHKVEHPFGFVIEESDWQSTHCSFFTTETETDLARWLSVLQVAPRRPVTRDDGGLSFGMALSPVGGVDGDLAGLGRAPRPTFGIAWSTQEQREMSEVREEDIIPEGGEPSLMPHVPCPGRESRVSRVSSAPRVSPSRGGTESDSDETQCSFASVHHPTEEAEDGYATPDDESEALGNLRRIARSLEAETAKLEGEIRAAECCAQLALAFFDETREGPSLESLHNLFVQLDQFAGEFKSAFLTLRAAAARAKPKSRTTSG